MARKKCSTCAILKLLCLFLYRVVVAHSELTLNSTSSNENHNMQNGRYGHTASLVDQDIFLFGGIPVNNISPFYDLFKIPLSSIATPTPVNPCSTSDIPPAVNFHTSVVFSRKMYVFGGKITGCDRNSNATHVYDVAQNKWILLKTENIPDARYGHCAVMYNSEMIVYGGCDDQGFARSDFQALNLVDNKWQELTFTGDVIQGRLNHTMNIVDDLMVIYGGTNMALEVFSDLIIVNLKDKIIHTVTIDNQQLLDIEEGRFGHVAVSERKDDKTIVLSVFGGQNSARNISRHSMAFTIDLESFKASVETIDHKIQQCNTQNFYPLFGTATQHPTGLLFYGDMPITTITSKESHADFNSVPDDVINIIYEYLECKDIWRMSTVSASSRLATLSNDNRYWRKKYESVITKPEYSIIMQNLQPNKSNTSYKSVIKEIVDAYYADSIAMGTTEKQIRNYIHKNVKLHQYGSFYHGYIGAGNLRGLFINVQSSAELMKKFGTTGELMVQNYQSQIVVPGFKAKAVTVGDGAVGKTCLIVTASGAPFPEYFIPTFSTDNVKPISLFGNQYDIEFLDLVGPEEHQRFRSIYYVGAHVFLLCFSLIRPSSFENIKAVWLPEITHYCPDAEILLIGTKQDLRDDENVINSLKEKGTQPISYEQGSKLAKDLGCIAYLETSSYKRVNVDMIPQYVLLAALMRKMFVVPRRKEKCLIA